MRKAIFLLTFFMSVAFLLEAQSPQSFKYQAIARDEAGNILSNWEIGIRINILKGGQDGAGVYSEIFKVTSSTYGMINLTIGDGENKSGEFNSINWGGDRHYIKLEMDINGTGDYKEMGTTQLHAVPYALYAEKAGAISGSGSGSGSNSSSSSSSSSSGNKSGSMDVRSGSPNTKFPASGNSFMNVNDGNVGVGTTTPSEKLEVNGNIYASGSIKTDDKLIMQDANGQPREVVLNADGTFSSYYICEDKIKDIRDGQYYDIIQIGSQCWMKENLNIGITIAKSVIPQNNSVIEKYCYDDDENNCDVYGGLYRWDEVMQYETNEEAQGICPASWHIPADWEWSVLEGFVDSNYEIDDPVWNTIGWRGFDVADKLKSTSGWDSDGNGTNTYGFNVLPSGYLNTSSDSYLKLAQNAYMWSSTNAVTTAYYRNLWSQNDLNYRDLTKKTYALALRCIKDFVCGDSLADPRDGQSYGTVKIGNLCWMSQNLNCGLRIDASTSQQDNSSIEKYCYNNLDAYCDTLGGLYQWTEAMQYDDTEGTRGICPPGWRLPTDDEFNELEGSVDTQYGVGDPVWETLGSRGFDAGKHLKSTSEWYNSGNGDDSSGFHGFPAGFASTGDFLELKESLYLWTSTADTGSNAWLHWLLYDMDNATRFVLPVGYGFSVRCVR